MVKCPWCPKEVPIEEYIKHYDEHVREEIERGQLMKEWKPPTITAVAPSLIPITPVPPTPLETRYYIKVDVQERQLKKARWWTK